MRRHHHILSSASNLLGIALIIITGLHLTHVTDQTLASKIAWLAALLLSMSVLLCPISQSAKNLTGNGRKVGPTRCSWQV